MKDLKLTDSELKVMKIVWENQPLVSGNLVKMCAEEIGWKKSTTYTVLKRLCEKQALSNDNSNITPLISQYEVNLFQSNQVVSQNFDGSLPNFLTAFMQGKKLSAKEAERLKQLIDSYKE